MSSKQSFQYLTSLEKIKNTLYYSLILNLTSYDQIALVYFLLKINSLNELIECLSVSLLSPTHLFVFNFTKQMIIVYCRAR
jgi:hypothetical protein